MKAEEDAVSERCEAVAGLGMQLTVVNQKIRRDVVR